MGQNMLDQSKYEPTCIITGRKDNLRMYSLLGPKGAMTGWVYVNVDFADELAFLDVDVKYTRDETKPIDI